MKMFLTVNGETIECYDVEVDGIDRNDAPDFCDAFIVSAYRKNENGGLVALTQQEIESIPSSDVYDAVCETLY